MRVDRTIAMMYASTSGAMCTPATVSMIARSVVTSTIGRRRDSGSLPPRFASICRSASTLG